MRRSSLAASLASIWLCLVLLTACNGVAVQSGPRPTATFGPAVQTRLAEANRPRPTRTPTPQVASTPTEPPPTSTPARPRPTPGPTSTPIPNPVDELLLAAMLEVDDLGDEWWASGPYTYGSSDQNWSGDDGMLVNPGSDDFCEAEVNDPYTHQVSAVFGHDAEEWLIFQFIAFYESEHHADLYLAELTALMQHCREYEEVYEDEVEVVRTSQLEYPEVGDRSAAFLTVTTGDGYQFEAVLAAFRVGRTVTVMFHYGESALNGPVEEWGTQEMVHRAAERVVSLKDEFDRIEEREMPNLV